MTTTQTPPATELATLVDSVREAVTTHEGWSETADLVAEALRRNLPTTGRADRRAARRLAG